MRINSIYRSVIGQSIYNRYNSSHNPNVGLHPRAGQPAADGYNTRPASQSKMGIMQDWLVSSIQGWLVHNPNVGLHPMAGQPAADEYNTRLASQSKMDTIHNWPVSLQ